MALFPPFVLPVPAGLTVRFITALCDRLNLPALCGCCHASTMALRGCKHTCRTANQLFVLSHARI